MSLALTAATRHTVAGSHAPRDLLGPVRSGRRFEPTVERLLDGDLMTLSTRLPGAAAGLALVREFHGGRGIADAVAITGWQEATHNRLALGLPFITNETDCSVMAAFSPNQTRTLPNVARKLGMSEQQLGRRISPLISGGYIEKSGSGYRRAHGFDPVGRAYALEAKVNDWRQGISQALRYSTWCDAAAVVLLKDPRNLTEVKSRCSQLGLGLAAEGRWAVRPRIGRPHPGLRLAASEKFVQQISELDSL